MNIHRLRVVDYDTPEKKLEGTSTIIERDEESSNGQKDDSGPKVNHKNTTSEKNGGGDQNATSDSAMCPASSKRLFLLKRRSKSELFRLPSYPKLKKLAPKNTSSSEDLKKTTKNKDRSNHRSRYNLVFNRDSILNLRSKGGDVKTRKNNNYKNEEKITLSDSETTNLTTKAINQKKEKNNIPKPPNDAFGFKKTNRQFDPCLYQMSCHFLDIDNHSTLNMLRKRFRYKHSRKKQKQQHEVQNDDAQNKHQQLRVLNSQVFNSPEKDVNKYYTLTGYEKPHKIVNEKPHKIQSTRKSYKDTWRRDYTSMILRKDANVFVSSSVLVPRTKYRIERACGRSPINFVKNQSPSQSKRTIKKSESVTNERQKLATKIVNSITSCKIAPMKSYALCKGTVRLCLKSICMGLFIIVWSPCLLTVLLALIIMSPWKITKLLGGNKTSCTNNTLFDKCKPKCLAHECQRICSNYTKSQEKGVLSSIASWFTRIAGNAAESYQATLSLIKLNKNRHPTCAGSSFVPKGTCKHPNPKARYNLYYASDRGWVMKPVHHHKQYADMRCEYSPKMQKSSQLCARLKKRRSQEVCCTSKDMILEVKSSKPKADECACFEAKPKNRGDGCRCTTPNSNSPETKKKQVNISPGQISPTVCTKNKSNVLCSCMHKQIPTNVNTVRLDNTACVPVSHFVSPHYCVGMFYGVTTNYPCSVLSRSIVQNKTPLIGKADNKQTEISPNSIKKHQSTSIDNRLNAPKTIIGRAQLLSNLQSNTTQTIHTPKLGILHSSQGQTIKSYPNQQACGILSQVKLVDMNFPMKTNSYQQTSIPRTPFASKIDLFHVLQSHTSKYFSNEVQSSSPVYSTSGFADKAISYTPPVIAFEHIDKNNEKNLRINKTVRYKTVDDNYHPNIQPNKTQLFVSEKKCTSAIEETTGLQENIKGLSKSTSTAQKKPFEKPSKGSQTIRSAFRIKSQGTMFPSESVLQTSKCSDFKKMNKFMPFVNTKRDPNNHDDLAKCSGCASEYHNSNKFPLCKKKEEQTKSSIHKVIPFIKGLALSCKHKSKNSHHRKASAPCPCEANITEPSPPLSKISERSPHSNKSPSFENIKCPCDKAAEIRSRKCHEVNKTEQSPPLSKISERSPLTNKSLSFENMKCRCDKIAEIRSRKCCEANKTEQSPPLSKFSERSPHTNKCLSFENMKCRCDKVVEIRPRKCCETKKTEQSPPLSKISERSPLTNKSLSFENMKCRCDKVAEIRSRKCRSVAESENINSRSSKLFHKANEIARKSIRTSTSPSIGKNNETKSARTSPLPERIFKRQDTMLTKKTGTSSSLRKASDSQTKVTKKHLLLDNASTRTLPGSRLLTKATSTRSLLEKAIKRLSKTIKTSTSSLQKSKVIKKISTPSMQKVTEPQSKVTKKISTSSQQKVTEPQSNVTKKTSNQSLQKVTKSHIKLTRKISTISLHKVTKKISTSSQKVIESSHKLAESKTTRKTTNSTSPKNMPDTQSMVTNTSRRAIATESKHATETSPLEKSPELPLVDLSRKSSLINNKEYVTNTKEKATSFEKVECACKLAALKSGENKFEGLCPCPLIRKPGTTRLHVSDTSFTEKESTCPCVAIRQYLPSNKKIHKKKPQVTCECNVKETQTHSIKKMSDKTCPCSQINENRKLSDIICKSSTEEDAQIKLSKKNNQYIKSQQTKTGLEYGKYSGDTDAAKISSLNNAYESLFKEKETQTAISKNISKDKSPECPCILINRYPRLQQTGDKTANTSLTQEKKALTSKMSDKACPCVLIRESPFKIQDKIKLNKGKKKKAVTCECKVKETQTELVKKTSHKACPCEIINQNPELCQAEGTSPRQVHTIKSGIVNGNQTETSLEKATVNDSNTKETIPLKRVDDINKTESISKDLGIHKNQATKASQISSKQCCRKNQQKTTNNQSSQTLVTIYRRSKPMYKSEATSDYSMNLIRTRKTEKRPSKLYYGGTKQLSQNKVRLTSGTQTKSRTKFSSQDKHALLSPQNQSTPKRSKILFRNDSSRGSLSYKHSAIMKTRTPTKISTQRSNISFNRIKRTSKNNIDLRGYVSRHRPRLASQRLLFAHDHTTQSETEPRSISRRAKINKPQKNISRCSLFSDNELQNKKAISRKSSSGSGSELHASNNTRQQSCRPNNLKSKFPRYSVGIVPSQTRIKSKFLSRDVLTASSSSQFRYQSSQIFSKTKLKNNKRLSYLQQFDRWRNASKPTEHENDLLKEPSCSTIFNETSSEESSQSKQLPSFNNMQNQPVIATCASPKKSAWFSSQKSIGLSNHPWSQLKQSVHSKSTQIHRITTIPAKTEKCAHFPEKQRVTRRSSKCNQTSKHSFFITDISNNCYRSTRKLQPQSRLRRKSILKDSSQQTFARNLPVNQLAPPVSEQGTGMSGLRICGHSKQALPKHSYRKTGYETKSTENKVQNIPDQQSRLAQQVQIIPTGQMASNTVKFPPYYISPYSNMLSMQGHGGKEVPQQLVSAPLLFGCPLSIQNNSPFGCPLSKENRPSFASPSSKQNNASLGCPCSTQTDRAFGYRSLRKNDPCFETVFKMQKSSQTCDEGNSITPNVTSPNQIQQKSKILECKCYDKKDSPKKQSTNACAQTKKEIMKCRCFEKNQSSRKIECEWFNKNTIQHADILIPPSTGAISKAKCTCSTQKPSSESIKCECYDENNTLKEKSGKDASSKIICEFFTTKKSSDQIECECRKLAKRQPQSTSDNKWQLMLPNLPGPGLSLVYQKPAQEKIQKSPAKKQKKKKNKPFNQADLDRKTSSFFRRKKGEEADLDRKTSSFFRRKKGEEADLDRRTERQRQKKLMKQTRVKVAIKKIKSKTSSGSSCWKQLKETVKETEEQAWPLEVTCNPVYIHTLKKKPHLWLFKLCPTMYPHFLNVFKVHSCMCQMFLYAITACACCPAFLCLYYCCRGVLCGMSG